MTTLTDTITPQRVATHRRTWPRRARAVPDAGLFDVRVAKRLDEAAVVTLHGSAGMVEAPRISETLEALLAEKPLLIVLDLSEMEFIGSCGLGAILEARHHCRLYGGQLRLARARPQVLDVLERTALTHLLPVYATTEEALRTWPSHLGRTPMFVLSAPWPVSSRPPTAR